MAEHDAANALPQAVAYLHSATVDRTGSRTAAARHACGRRANELGAVIVAEYSDVGSALTDDRQQLAQMLADLTTMVDITYVIAPSHTTIARNMQVYARIVWKIEQAGGRLVVASAPIEGYQNMQRHPLGTLHAVADWADQTQDSHTVVHRTDRPEPSA
jgi:DNA invertase Pin-like site-specific DNA recombinase